MKTLRLTRRRFLYLAGLSGAALVIPGCGEDRYIVAGGGQPQPPPEFLTQDELAIVEAATARLFPTDDTAGAREADVANYVQGLLSIYPADDAAAAATELPHVFGGGPFSGRQPYLDAERMAPSNDYPPDEFAIFIPLNRLQRIAWMARIRGLDAAPEIASNPLADPTGTIPGAEVVGLQDLYRQGLLQIEDTSQTTFSASFVDLDPAQQDKVLAAPSLSSFVLLLTNHTIEGMFSAPEYGGNRDLIGWQLIGYGGDSQPLGYVWGFDERTGQYVEDPERPDSLPDPGEDCAGFSDVMQQFLSKLVATVELGQEFPNPYCFGVDG